MMAKSFTTILCYLWKRDKDVAGVKVELETDYFILVFH
jgi:hypothetical protein